MTLLGRPPFSFWLTKQAQNSPLHLSTYSNSRDPLSYHFLAHTTLDIFAARMPSKTNGDSDFGLLCAVDDQLSLYGWLTNTGVKIVVGVETPVGAIEGGVDGGMGIREGELKAVGFILEAVGWARWLVVRC